MTGSALGASSGSSRVDALVNGGTNLWWGDKSKDGGKSYQLTYSMLGRSLDSTATDKDKSGYRPMTSVQTAAVTKALAYISSVINVKFTPGKAGQSDINFGTNKQNGESGGYANPPNASGAHKPYVMLANDVAINTSPAPGNYGWQTLVHEIGHALGLKHPGDYNAGGGGGTGPFLSASEDNQRNSIMSYNATADATVFDYKLKTSATGASISGSTTKAGVYGFMQYDLDALQYLYGANTKQNGAGQVTQFTSTWKGFQTLWAPLASSKIDTSKVAASNIIDMREGAFSSINIQSSTPADIRAVDTKFNSNFAATFTSANTYFGYNNVALATGSKVSSVLGGLSKDVIYANQIDKLSIDGGQGTDTLYLSGTQDQWSFKGTGANGTFTNTLTKQIVTTKNIEAIKYYDAASHDLSHSSVDLTA